MDDTVLAERFEVGEEIGRGAYGRTYGGRDLDSGAAVAIKELMLRDVHAWKTLELFEREGEVLEHLDHPNIPAYLDAFHIADPDEGTQRFFLVQEYVEGDDYQTLLEDGLTITEPQAREILEQILEVLVYLQERSPPIIHRDIKPSNIMRRADGGLALIDFGAVQSVIPKAEGGSTIIGTTGYMPHEQLMGRAVAATDLYAAAATIVHLVSRRHPADLPMRKMRLAFEEFVALSPEFTAYLKSLLEPDVEERVATADAALRALRRIDASTATSDATRSEGRSTDLSRASQDAESLEGLLRLDADEVDDRTSSGRSVEPTSRETSLLGVNPWPAGEHNRVLAVLRKVGRFVEGNVWLQMDLLVLAFVAAVLIFLWWVLLM